MFAATGQLLGLFVGTIQSPGHAAGTQPFDQGIDGIGVQPKGLTNFRHSQKIDDLGGGDA